ncbi:MAG: hypothetical protein U9N62_08830 [Thermotogota bacterium]|nr:hypothetical protein [Thermotogota bacterium]
MEKNSYDLLVEHQGTFLQFAQKTGTDWFNKLNIVTTTEQLVNYSQIKDDGVGCAHLTFGMAISGIKERVDSLKGEMNVLTQKGEGFEITIKLPRRISEVVKA